SAWQGFIHPACIASMYTRTAPQRVPNVAFYCGLKAFPSLGCWGGPGVQTARWRWLEQGPRTHWARGSSTSLTGEDSKTRLRAAIYLPADVREFCMASGIIMCRLGAAVPSVAWGSSASWRLHSAARPQLQWIWRNQFTAQATATKPQR